ncbi:hypothetical protein BCR39DRAFT_548243 [Naematelia encephala]|uniref:Uncharacterized protein n=1 Tax=Naematelia encephala TaxID=71784 RepID=A0A1Y2AN50_9TREE|nr:hypothetical protein BCR39DRAFT_548243 [Naematelia encephala]
MTKLQLKAERRAARLRLRQYRWALDGEYERRFRGVMRGYVAGIIRFEKDNIKDGKSFLDTTPTELVQRYTMSFRNLRKSSSAAFSPLILDLAKIPKGSAFRMPVRARDAVRRGVKNEDERLRRKKEAKAARLAKQAQLTQANGPPPPYAMSETTQVRIQEAEDKKEEEQEEEEDEDEDEGTDDELKTPTTSNIHPAATITSLLPGGTCLEIERDNDSLKSLTPILAVQSPPLPTYPPVRRQSATPTVSTPVSPSERDEVAIRDEIVRKIMDNMRRLDLLRAELRDSVSSADTSAVEKETETMKKMLVNVLRRHGDAASPQIAEEEGVDEHALQGDEVEVRQGSELGTGLQVEVEVESQSVPNHISASLHKRVGSLNIDDDTRLFALSKNRSDASQISSNEDEEAQEADSDTSSSTISSAYESNESFIATVDGNGAREILGRRRGMWGNQSGESDLDSDVATAR